MDPKTLNAIVHDREAAFYDERFAISFDGTLIAREVRRDLARVLGELPRISRALDVACGTGYAAVGLAAAGIAAEVHGCDLSAGMLERAASNAKRAGVEVSFALCDGERLPYTDGVFDLVVARGALHHLPDPVEALREIRRVLAPGGAAVVLAEPTPNGEHQVALVIGTLARGVQFASRLLRRTKDEEHERWELASMAANLHTFTPADLERAAIKAGFEEIEISTAWWAWVLALGFNYYLAGESAFLERNRFARLGRRFGVGAAQWFDRAVAERLVPRDWHHTVQAVLR
jgi:ubiquinone/menaquinone biosynthesis C-methylase UbiE